MKKGFTLIEVVTVLVLLAVIGLIVVPTVNLMIKKSTEDLYENQLEEIRLASEKWAYNNLDLLPSEEGKSVTITLLELKRGGYLPPDIKNPKTNEPFSNGTSVVITYKQNDYEYVVKENIINTEITENSPSLVMNGEIIEVLEVGENYIELGAVALDKDANELDYIITYYDNDKEIANIDTKNLKTYTIEYSVTDKNYNLTTIITRTVIIQDTTSPTITLPGKVTITKTEASNYNLLNGVTITDNSGESITPVISGFDTNIGEKIVSYNACDSSGNCSTVNRIIVVK